MAKQLTELRFPAGGLNRQAGFEQQPPYTTPYCVNVRPFDVVNLSSAEMHGMRQRGGARPGIAKAYAQKCGEGPIQMLAYASALGSDGIAANILLAVSEGILYQDSSGGMVAVSGSLNPSSSRLRGTQVGGKFYIADYRETLLRSPVNAPDGTIASGNRLSATSVSDWTALSIDMAQDVVWISGETSIESNIFPIVDVKAGYIVFNGTMTNQAGDVVWQIGRIPKVFDPENPTAALTVLMGTLPIPRANFDTGTVSSTNGVVTLIGSSWSSVPSPTADISLVLTIPNASGIGTQDYLVATKNSNSQLTLIDQTADADCSDVTYKLEWTSDYYGIPPLGCPLCCTYRGSLMLAGPGAIWYKGRVLNPNDWDYGYDPADPSRAVGGTSTTTGGIPDPLLALMPHSDDYLIFGCQRSLWLLTGDPAYGGQITNLSREIGVLGPDAWCNLPDGSMVILSSDGVYKIAAGGASYPTPISRSLLPAELLDVDWVNNTVSMCFDVRDRGIHLFVTPVGGTAGTHYFIDLTTGSFWPVTLPNAMQPAAMVRYSSGSTIPPKVILGCHDGYLRNYSANAITDDGTAFSSVVVYGPFSIGGPGYVGEILQIFGTLDSNGQDVAWGIFPGDNAQAAVASAVSAGVASGAPWNGTWAAAASHRQFPRASGAALVVMVSGTYGWAIEGILVEGRQKGPIR